MVDAFVETARAFCAFIDSASPLTSKGRLNEARRRLLELYAAALLLPIVTDVSADPLESPEPVIPASWRPFDELDFYWEVFDATEQGEPVVGSLSDDFLDIYRDLRRGFGAWERGAENEAIWEWRFSLHAHWGDHAMNALRALHYALKRV